MTTKNTLREEHNLTYEAVKFADFVKGLDYLADLIGVERGKIEGWIGFWLDDEQKAKLIQAAKDYNAFYELSMQERIDLLNQHNKQQAHLSTNKEVSHA